MARLDGAARHDFGVARGRDFTDTLVVTGDYSSDTFTGEVRLYPDAAGAAILTMTVGTPTFASGVTTIALSITDTDLAGGGVPAGSPAGSDVTLHYDIQRVTGGLKSTFLYGKFTIFGKVTA